MLPISPVKVMLMTVDEVFVPEGHKLVEMSEAKQEEKTETDKIQQAQNEMLAMDLPSMRGSCQRQDKSYSWRQLTNQEAGQKTKRDRCRVWSKQ